ncbi:MAG: PilZ domain-containing protein, partial [Pseudomonadota bacterium]
MAVKVKRERPDQRRHHRVTAPLFVDVGGWRLRATDWSLGGLRLDNYPDAVPEPGTEIDLHLTLPFQGFEVAFDAKAEVVRNDPASGMFAVQFTEIGERERELMSHFIEQLIRGSMTDIEETINRIDVPVTPASLKPDASPAADVPVKRWPIKTLVMTGVYAILGLVVFGYTAMLVYTNFFRLEVLTAVVTAPVDQVRARADGRVVWQEGIAEGVLVREGQLLVAVMDTELEREIELAEINIRQQEAKLLYLRQRQTDEMKRAENFAEVELKNVRQSRLALEALQAELATAVLKLNRISRLHKKGFATDVQRDEAERDVIALRKKAGQAKVELDSRASLADTNKGRRLYTGENIVGELGEIEAQVSLAAN